MTQIDLLSETAKVADNLLRNADLGPLCGIEAIAGGRNNRAYRIASPRGHWLFKQYFQDPSGGRDRCGSEWDWSTFCWKLGVRACPEPIATDSLHRASLFEFITGRHLEQNQISANHVEQAASYVAEVNRFRDHPAAMKIAQAAESCFSMEEHLACVEQRIERLEKLAVNERLDAELQDWLQKSLRPVWNSLQENVRSTDILHSLTEKLPQSQRCLSPSDFGFHNALLERGGQLRFLDFEYAGWDDPAKLVCDFFWQPQFPVPRQWAKGLISAFMTPDSEPQLIHRIHLLFPVYGIKWCCLILNEFVVSDRQRREFAQAMSLENGRKFQQLENAKQLLQALTLNPFAGLVDEVQERPCHEANQNQ